MMKQGVALQLAQQIQCIQDIDTDLGTDYNMEREIFKKDDYNTNKARDKGELILAEKVAKPKHFYCYMKIDLHYIIISGFMILGFSIGLIYYLISNFIFGKISNG